MRQDFQLLAVREKFMLRCRLSGILFFLCYFYLLPAPAAEPGFADAPPATGPVIKVGERYLVPYTVTLADDVSFTMIPVPGGKFRLGSPANEPAREVNEGPPLEVEVPPFWIGQAEVTWGEYKLYMASLDQVKNPDGVTAAPLTAENAADAVTIPSKLYEPTYTFEHGDNPRLPAVTMSQFGARQYTKWLSRRTGQIFRLPNEIEWEYACRAGSDTPYSHGNDPEQLGEYAWTAENSDEVPHLVMTKKPNAWGLYDMHGNVLEWTLDAYTPAGYDAAVQAPAGLAATNWPKQLFPRVLRGGSFEFSADRARSAARTPSDDKTWYDTDPNRPKSPWWLTDDPARGVGMRIIRPVAPPTAEERVKMWEIDNPQTERGVTERLKQGRGTKGVVLPQAVK
ncbi:MAG: SUMF1/EgtB/PvdO family nonheme iron enzyme [Pirellulales bacterium]|nr:SUMF1/EgtB/PvdO family nonheme iron enzyme [Pirellulales bacterium]